MEIKAQSQHPLNQAISLVTALLLAASMCFAGNVAADAVKGSSFYQQSRILKMIVVQDGVGLTSILEDGKSVDMALKFVEAVTSAYISFELIPVYEAKTFAAIFESLSDDVTVERFQYRRRDLTITGVAADLQSYVDFVENLQSRDYFSQVTGTSYINVEDEIRFEIQCIAKSESQSVLLPLLLPPEE